ncbi:ACR3 family arsenite efflux transporter [Suttonella sp. R2A3]|uniref:ACR3 family arsenite efflux transporter n=1 Tax=Suttonella sp. R2A3 TaxID=2908648 RepID=UPI001F3E61F8|nr:ACR3 family arsenite efflux transporter [Suttonella sp. R2A3]UJF25172.1 ACR3 family arsenite efflux transporter [Suttonella sp. R2A3]
MGFFERWLSVWVGLSIIAGLIVGSVMPQAIQGVARFEFAQVNLLIALLIWLMIYPMMLQINWSEIRAIGTRPRGLMLTIVVNWLIKPFTMALIAWLFFYVFYTNWVSPESAQEYIAGMILLGVAPCTAMVFVWSHLVKGDANYTLVQVAVNDVIMVVAFVPIAGLLLGISDISIPWMTLLLSVVLYVVLPLVAGILTQRYYHLRQKNLPGLIAKLKPLSILGLIFTVVLLFAFQAQTILDQPLIMLLIAIPLLLQTYFIFFIAWFGAKVLRIPLNIAAPACLIGTSNFFELAVAVAIALFGLNSGAALATVVGVLVEVPVMLSLVWLINHRLSRSLSM